MSIHWGGRGPGHMSRLPRGVRPAWVEPGALIDLDDENGRFYVNGQTYATLAAATTAMGGTNSGQALSVGPYLTGVIPYTSDFSSGIDGWAETTNPDNGSMAASSGDLVATVTTGQYRVAKQVSVTRKAILAKARRVSSTTANPTLGCGNTGGMGGTNSGLATMSANGDYSTVGGTDTTSIYIGFLLNGAGALTADNVSGEVVIPYEGFAENQLRFEIDFTSPASFAAQKVLAQWGISNASGQSVRVLTNTSGELRVIVNSGSAEVANLNLGVISTATRYRIRATLADSAFHANLDGGPLVSDTSGNMPPMGLFWRGRSFSGETFDGTIHRSKVWANAASDPNDMVEPTLAFRIYGDSTADGAGSTTDWYQNLVADYTPDRAYAKNAAGGETSAQMLARVAADTSVYRDWTTIFMDRPNTGESSTDWIANIKAAVAYLQTERWYVHPPVQDVPDTSITNISEVQAALLSDPFFDGHTLGAGKLEAYITEMSDGATRSDTVHDSDAGAVIRAVYIKAFMDDANW